LNQATADSKKSVGTKNIAMMMPTSSGHLRHQNSFWSLARLSVELATPTRQSDRKLWKRNTPNITRYTATAPIVSGGMLFAGFPGMPGMEGRSENQRSANWEFSQSETAPVIMSADTAVAVNSMSP